MHSLISKKNRSDALTTKAWPHTVCRERVVVRCMVVLERMQTSVGPVLPAIALVSNNKVKKIMLGHAVERGV